MKSRRGGLAPGGFADLAGNVREWTASDGDDDGRTRVVRGGSWGDSLPSFLAASFRGMNLPHVLVDARTIPGLACPQTPLVGEDARDGSIAAASIVAKVTRNRIMRTLDKRYPGFGFAENKGYGTPDHWDALDRHGPTPVHRLSFSGVGQVALPGLGRSMSPSETMVRS